MVAVQHADRLSGRPMLTRLSFIRENSAGYVYMIERELPDRTIRAHEFLAAGLFQFQNLETAKRIWPTLLVVPEMKAGVVEKLKARDVEIGRAIVGEQLGLTTRSSGEFAHLRGVAPTGATLAQRN